MLTHASRQPMPWLIFDVGQGMKKRSGIDVLEEKIGDGCEVERHKWYRLSLRMWLRKGEPIKWSKPFGLLDQMVISEDGFTLTADYRFDREYLLAGLFYGLEGMKIGGRRVLLVSPHLAFRDAGVEGMVPPKAVLRIEVEVVGTRVI